MPKVISADIEVVQILPKKFTNTSITCLQRLIVLTSDVIKRLSF